MIRNELIALVPMKPLSMSKTRLSVRLTRRERETLSFRMLQRVLQALDRAGVNHTSVVGGDAPIRQLARQQGTCSIPEAGSCLNESLESAFAHAFRTARAALYLPGDLPFATSEDVRGLVAASRRLTTAVLVPDRRGDGTNGLLMTGDLQFRLALGPGSFRQHLASANASGVAVKIYDSPGLRYDLDTARDYQLYERLDPDLLGKLTFHEGEG